MNKDSLFGRFSKCVAHWCGTSWAFLIALLVILIWVVTGPIFEYSDTWQLVINTGTTIITFLMVFIIQHTQNKDSVAMQLKMDELIRATKGAHNALIDLEELNDREIEKIRGRYLNLAEQARQDLRKGQRDDNKPEVSETFNIAKKNSKKKPAARKRKA